MIHMVNEPTSSHYEAKGPATNKNDNHQVLTVKRRINKEIIN